jgi:hypothetical protein
LLSCPSRDFARAAPRVYRGVMSTPIMSTPTTAATIGDFGTPEEYQPVEAVLNAGMASSSCKPAVENYTSPLTAPAPLAANRTHESFFIVEGLKVSCTLCDVECGKDVPWHACGTRHRAKLKAPWRPPRSPVALTLEQYKSSGIEQQLQLRKKDVVKERKQRRSIEKKQRAR